jgi:L-threonylcarbamoyladenylate synthase
LSTEILPNHPKSFAKAAKLLIENEVVALPTETVYGLAGNAFQDLAVQKIFKAKDRPAYDPLIVHLSERYLHDPKKIIPALVQDGILAPEILSAPELTRIHEVMKQFWPGPLTLILPRGNKIPDSVTAAQPTVGILIPAHPVFQAILSQLPFPLAAPSANRFGRISPTEALHVMSELKDRIPAIVEGGPCDVGVESTIVKIDFPFQVTLLRPGKISADALERAFQKKITITPLTSLPKQKITPGSLDEHYAPKKPLYLMPHSFFEIEKTREFLNTEPLPQYYTFLKMHDISRADDLEEIAKNLFKSLRLLDEDPEVEAILADLPKDIASGLGAAIADRLKRASRNKPNLP